MAQIPSVPYPKHWLLGHTQHFASDTRGFVLTCAANGQSIAKAKIAFKDFVILLDPESIRHVLQKKHKNYPKSFAYQGLKEILGNGLLTAEADEWLANRRKLQPFFSHEQIGELKADIATLVDQKLSQLTTGEIELQPLFLDWTKSILTEIIFGVKDTSGIQMQALSEDLWFMRNHANQRMKNPFMAPAWVPNGHNREFRKRIKSLHAILVQLIQKAKKEQGGSEFLLTMLAAINQSEWTEQQVFDELLTMYMAGQETTTNAMVFLVHCLCEHPAVLSRLNDPTDLLRWEHVIQEVLRLYPPAWAVSRKALENDVLGDYPIVKGTTMFLSIYAMHRHPAYWEDPNAFKPERFLSDYPKEAYLPFGFGPRMCIGNHLVLLEMQVMAEKLFKAFHIERKDQAPLELITPMTMSPKHPYWVKLSKL